MNLFRYAFWGFSRNRQVYKLVYLSVFLMSALVFLSLSSLSLSSDQLAVMIGNEYGNARLRDAPILLAFLGTSVWALQIFLVLVRVQKDRGPEYQVLEIIGFSPFCRAFVASLENLGHILIASLPGVGLGVAIAFSIKYLLDHESKSRSLDLPSAILGAILLPAVITVPVCGALAGRRRVQKGLSHE